MSKSQNPSVKYFLYARKSSEAEDRQVASIDAQIAELKKLAQELKLNIITILSEAKSAKAPGRPVFNQMLERISKGEANGILCWKLDRLARNPVDGGQISWPLQQGVIKCIQTYGRAYYPEDNVLTMAVELGMANQFVRDLSVNVKRGLRRKVETGYLPGVAQSGYLNTPDREKGFKIVVKDPERFPLVRKMWDLMLTGNYTPPRILKIANEEWGYRTVKRRNSGGKTLARSSIYKIFTNPFYYGWFEWPKGSGNWHKGEHEPMITREEYDRVQVLLGRKGKPAPQTRVFAYTGLMRCGECGCSITAEEKNQIICSNCKFKFGYENKKSCPKCGIAIEKMKNPTILKYIYYHCTKKKNQRCTQGCVRVEELERQINDYLGKIQISQKYVDWAIKHLQQTHELETAGREVSIQSQQKTYNETVKKLDALLEMRLKDEIEQDEYLTKKSELTKEKERYQELLRDADNNQNKWLERAEAAFNFAHRARKAFVEGGLETKREILATIGYNLTLKDKKLSVEAPYPFSVIENALVSIPEAREGLEPKILRVGKRKREPISSLNPRWLRW